MKKVLKWVGIVVVCLVVIGFLAFLYLIPPFDLLPREAFIKPRTDVVAASLEKIDDPAERAIAERGRYIMSYSDCSDCHTPQGEEGPNWSEYLAGGFKFERDKAGTAYSMNLTPNKETGLARRTDEEIKRVLRSGVGHDGRVYEPTFMAWPGSANMTEEDRYAVVVYLRHIKPVKHKLPDYSPNSSSPGYKMYPYDFGQHEKK